MFIKMLSRNPHLYWVIEITLLAMIFSLIVLLSRPSSTPTAAAQSQRTPTRAPTRSPTPPTGQFSSAGANSENPGDVLDELWSFDAGAGEDLCEDIANTPVIIDQEYSTSPMILDVITVQSCGWKNGERVNLLVQYPNAKRVNRQATAEKGINAYGVMFPFQTSLQDPPGVYKFTFTGRSGRASGSIKIIRPPGPYAYWFEDGKLLLYQLQPYEKVRLYAYEFCGSECKEVEFGYKLAGWKEYRVDRYGSLWISVAYDRAGGRPDSIFQVLQVIGEKSGVTGYLNYAHPGENKGLFEPHCPGAPPQRMFVGIEGRICTKRDRVIVHEAPRRSSRELFRLSPGATFEVIGGPVCSDNWSWWKIEAQYGRSGWIAEGGDTIDRYFICP